MSRGRRFNREKQKSGKYLIYLSAGTMLLIFLIFVVTFIVYNNKLKSYNYSSLTTEKIAELVPNDAFNTEAIEKETAQASTEIGKSIAEVVETMEEEIETKESESSNRAVSKTKQAETNKNSENTEKVEEKVKDPEFIIPVDGEIYRSFAKDSLIYSDTLEEWVTHLGIDIKADRTSVVKASEEGTIESIKNDPRYGLTIVIEHVNGYKTVYSNLLTTEFVSEGEKVKKGQSIGTVGNSAAFEIVDEPHLHFEILKDNVNVDPNIYLK